MERKLSFLNPGFWKTEFWEAKEWRDLLTHQADAIENAKINEEKKEKLRAWRELTRNKIRNLSGQKDGFFATLVTKAITWLDKQAAKMGVSKTPSPADIHRLTPWVDDLDD